MRSASPLFNIFNQQIVPWVEQYGISKIAVAQPSWRAWQAARENSPDDILGTPKPLLSKRKAIKGRRPYGNAAMEDARWPEDGLNSFRTPNLAFILSGAVLFPLGGYQLHCRPGHGVLVPPGVAKSDGTHLCLDDAVPRNTACDILNICPFSGAIACWLSHTRDGRHWSAHSPEERCYIHNGQAVFYLEALCTEMLKQEPRYDDVCRGLLTALVNVIWRELRRPKHMLPASFSQSGLSPALQVTQDPIALAQEYVHNHLSDPLSLEGVARHVYMSRRLFTDRFLQKTGKTFQEYLNDCRFEKACHLLQQTDWSIKVIGVFVGLKPTRLRELFQQRENVSPTNFRRRK
jgi:AraC-like DNA-binding protein